MIKEIWNNRKLIFKLAKNDFKTRYAGSYLGIVWAFVQPIITIIVYWFVFEYGLSAGAQLSRNGIEIPFVLWLSAGLVPWFFFSEALSSATNALIEYNYLVKKVVFKIEVLPVVKVLSSSFVHVFFVLFVLILYSCYGYFPDVYTVQVFYYSFCMFMMVLAISYTTCAVVVFFRDLSHIIGIFLQVGVWATPIMWNFSIIHNPVLEFIFKLNPMFYIVQGYREALIEKTWFWQSALGQTAYFWILTIVLFAFGKMMFNRLKPHFADVL
ncbi:MAG: ABC transporter permease [Lachnospiraceae bacterium]|nr:ABC transporter permease [Lachnospiraceae bacterium]